MILEMYISLQNHQDHQLKTTGIRFYCPIAIKYLPVPPYDDPTPIEDTDTEYTVFASEGVPEC